MPVRLHDFIHAAGRGDDGIAGFLEPGARPSAEPHRFVYWRSSNPMLPAFVNCLEGGGDMRRVYTDHEAAPWASPRGPGVKRRDNLRSDDGDGSLVIEPVPMTTRPWPARVAGPDLPAPLPGGLHAAALASSTCIDTTEGRDETGGADASGPARSLRHYMLATRTLIAASATSGFAGVHDHVGALLVGDDGRILAAGINTGSYRHAEVSLLLSWFRDHPEARTLPAKSIVLSTLTPCRQCTRYLALARAPDTSVLFDEADAGRSGRVGERIARRIDMGIDMGIGTRAGMEPDTGTGTGTDAGLERGTDAVREAERRAVRNAGRSGTGGPSRIDRSNEARRALLEAARPHRDVRADERSAEAAVLVYLARWILGATRVA